MVGATIWRRRRLPFSSAGEGGPGHGLGFWSRRDCAWPTPIGAPIVGSVLRYPTTMLWGLSEVLAWRWESLNFGAGWMLVERAVVDGRIGPTKTETSKDEVPLDGDLASVLLEWQKKLGSFPGLYSLLFHWRMVQRQDVSEATPETCW